MTPEQAQERAAAFNDEMMRLADAGNGRDILAYTGEELARVAEELRKATAEELGATAAMLLYVARAHVSALYDAGMATDALATSLMVLMTILMARVDPEEIPMVYLSYLQNLCFLAADTSIEAESTGIDPEGHLSAITSMVVTLATATAQAFDADKLSPRIVDIGKRIAAEAAEPATLNGRPITATMAIDVAADALARLRTMCEF